MENGNQHPELLRTELTHCTPIQGALVDQDSKSGAKRQDHKHKSIFSNLNYFKKGWFCQDIKGTSVAH